MMRKIVAFCLTMALAAGLAAGIALADVEYIIPDSSTRELTWEELWTWDYESLGYIFNEIFARHGYNFIPGEAFDDFFRDRPWYTPNADPDNQRACYSQLSNLEWDNVDRVKEVREVMRLTQNYNTSGKSIWDMKFSSVTDFAGFTYVSMQPNQKLAVYSAPSTDSWRGASGNAALSTNGSVYAAGWDRGWLMVMYEINQGAKRVGYINGSDLRGPFPDLGILQFAYKSATVDRLCTLTDDPALTGAMMTTLMPGTVVSYLMTYDDDVSWAYIETLLDGKIARGFVPADCITVDESK